MVTAFYMYADLSGVLQVTEYIALANYAIICTVRRISPILCSIFVGCAVSPRAERAVGALSGESVLQPAQPMCCSRTLDY